MKNTKFVVKVNRSGTHRTRVCAADGSDSYTATTNRKLALVMGKFMAEDTSSLSKTLGASRSWCRYRPVHK